ncbi:hypothetical protein OAU50_00815 [Planctomycetota bacterium]|nr:hypothetical protein [Planctomycetota bacterium]
MNEFLQSIEPYSSYRFIMGLVLTGLTIYMFAMSYVSFRNFKGFLAELNQNAKEQRVFDEVRKMIAEDYDVERNPTLTANPGRVIKLAAIEAALKVFTWRTAVRLMPEILSIIALATGCAVAYYFVFTGAL